MPLGGLRVTIESVSWPGDGVVVVGAGSYGDGQFRKVYPLDGGRLDAAADTGLAPGNQVAAAISDYDAFMKLSPDQRRARFDALSAENKAEIVRTHVEHWLHSNRHRLTASEAAVFAEDEDEVPSKPRR